MNVGDSLGKKYGPLPGTAWLLLIALGVFFLIKTRQSKAAKSGSGSGVGPQTSALIAGGQGNNIRFDTASTVTQTFNTGPGAGGGKFDNTGGTYYGPGVTTPAPTVVTTPATSPSHPHRHVHYRRDEWSRGGGDGGGHHGGHGGGGYGG